MLVVGSAVSRGALIWYSCARLAWVEMDGRTRGSYVVPLIIDGGGALLLLRLPVRFGTYPRRKTCRKVRSAEKKEKKG